MGFSVISAHRFGIFGMITSILEQLLQAVDYCKFLINRKLGYLSLPILTIWLLSDFETEYTSLSCPDLLAASIRSWIGSIWPILETLPKPQNLAAKVLAHQKLAEFGQNLTFQKYKNLYSFMVSMTSFRLLRAANSIFNTFVGFRKTCWWNFFFDRAFWTPHQLDVRVLLPSKIVNFT